MYDLVEWQRSGHLYSEPVQSLAEANVRFALVMCLHVMAEGVSQGSGKSWGVEVRCADEVCDLVCWKGDTKWQLLAPGVWGLPADADGAPGSSSYSEKAVELGSGETQNVG